MRTLLLVMLLTASAAARGFLMADLHRVDRHTAVRYLGRQAGYEAIALVPLEGKVDLRLRGESLEEAFATLLPSEAGFRYFDEHKAILIAPRDRLWKLELLELWITPSCGAPAAKIEEFLQFECGAERCTVHKAWLVAGMPAEVEAFRNSLAR